MSNELDESVATSYEVCKAHREEQKANSPQVSAPVLLSDLANEYPDDNVVKRKITAVSESYKYYRKVRKDGACFYRGIGFGLLERVNKNKESKTTDSILKALQESKPLIERAGYDLSTIEDFFEAFTESVELAQNETSTIETIEELFDDTAKPGISDSINVCLRILTSTCLKLNEETFLPFIPNYANMEEYCKAEVDPVWAEADNIHAMALTQILPIVVKVVYVDAVNSTNFNVHKFPDADDSTNYCISLLYTPGHYDILL